MKKLLLIIAAYAFQVHLIFGQLTGLKTVGNGGDYPDLYAAIQELNSNGLSGNTILEIKDGFDVTQGYTIHSYAGMDQFHLTIRPEPGASEVILRSHSGTVLWLDSVINLTIDGRPGGETNQRVLKFLHNANFNSSTIAAHQSKNTIIKNCYIRFDGTRGIDLMNSDSCTVDNCDIATYTNGPVTNNATIAIEASKSTNIALKNNIIHDLHVDSVHLIFGIDIYAPDAIVSMDSLYNNFISVNTGTVDSSVNIRGINIQDGDGNLTYLYFNTIVIGGNQINGENYSSYGLSCEMKGEAIIKNNIFINNRSNASGTMKHYCAGFVTHGAVSITSDYNLFQYDDIDGILGFYNNDYTTLTDWQNNTGFDLNSVVKGITFAGVEAGDLHLSGSSVSDSDLYGLYIEGINDIDNEQRWPDSTFMGADQPSIIEPCIPEPENDPDNILENGNFGACSLSPWDLYYSSTMGIVAGAVLMDGTCEISVSGLSTNPLAWDIQLNQVLSSTQLNRLQQGCRYDLSFDAFSDKNNSHLRVSFEQSVDPWNNIFNKGLILGTTSGSYSFEIIVDTIFLNTQLSLQVGLDTATTTIDNVKLKKKSDTVSVPGIIEAEEFNLMKGTQWEITSDTSGGLDITSLTAGDWIEYSIHIPATDLYTVSYRIAGISDGQIALLQNSESIDTVNIPGTGGEQVWKTVNTILNLTAGIQKIRLLVLAGEWNMNWWRVEKYVPTLNNQENIDKEIVFPNPANETLHIQTDKDSKIKLYNAFGVLIKEETILNNPAQIDISDLPEGYYLIKVNNTVHKISIIR